MKLGFIGCGNMGEAFLKGRLVPYYSKFGFKNEGVSSSVHGGVVWYQMRLEF